MRSDFYRLFFCLTPASSTLSTSEEHWSSSPVGPAAVHYGGGGDADAVVRCPAAVWQSVHLLLRGRPGSACRSCLPAAEASDPRPLLKIEEAISIHRKQHLAVENEEGMGMIPGRQLARARGKWHCLRLSGCLSVWQQNCSALPLAASADGYTREMHS